MALDPAVRAVMTKINRKYGDGTVLVGSEIIAPERDTITSGSLSLDVALGGGWAVNHWIEIVGHRSAGKSMIVLKTIAANQKADPNWTVVWFATEDFVEDYALMLGVDLDRVIVENENTMETVYQHVMEFLETRSIDCIVIDSLPALVPAREVSATMEEFQPGLAAFLTGKFFRMSNPSMKRSLTEIERPVTGFLINQWRSKIGGYGDPRTKPGGVAGDFYCFQQVDVRRDEWIRNSREDPIGQVLKIVNIKNKFARPGRVASIDAYFAKGNGFEAGDYDLSKDSISAGLAYDVIQQQGGYFTFDKNRWHGRAAMHEAVRNDGRLQSRLRKAVLAVAESPLPLDPPERKRTSSGTKSRSSRSRNTSVRASEDSRDDA